MAQAYHDFLDMLVVDIRDAEAAEELRQTGLRVHVHQDHHAHIRRQGRPGPAGACPQCRTERGAVGPGSPMILVPVKNLKEAKQRLASVLDPASADRTRAGHAARCTEALACVDKRPEVAIVTCDRLRFAGLKYGFEVIADHATAAKPMPSKWRPGCAKRANWPHAGDPGAIFRWSQAWEIEEILDAAPEVGTVLVPAGDGRGTNAVLRRPAALFPLRFGNDSFRPHLAAAQAPDKPCVVLPLPGIAVDVDNPSDLRQLVRTSRRDARAAAGAQWDLTDYPLGRERVRGRRWQEIRIIPVPLSG